MPSWRARAVAPLRLISIQAPTPVSTPATVRPMAFSAPMRNPSNSSTATAEPSATIPKWNGKSLWCANQAGMAVAPSRTPVYVASSRPNKSCAKQEEEQQAALQAFRYAVSSEKSGPFCKQEGGHGA